MIPEPPAPPRRRRIWPRVVGITGVLALVAVGTIALTWDAARSHYIQDTWTVWTEPAPAEIEDIADATGMSDLGRLIFLATKPEIEAAADFNGNCDIEGVVLGCYRTPGDRIHLFRVTDERLAGTTESTAAHEMLHAAYWRLGRDEQEGVDALLQAYLDALPADAPLREELALYDESQWIDELHSRLGVQVADLPAELEAHYALYFDDRSRVLERYEASRASLGELQARIDALAAEIEALAADIDARSSAYDADLAALDADIAAFNDRAQEPGGFATQSAFDAARADLVARSEDIDARRAMLNADVDRHNALVDELGALDADRASLYSSLDSRSAPADVG